MTTHESKMQSLPPKVQDKIKQLHFKDCFVPTAQKSGIVTELASGKEVLEPEWSYTMKGLAKQLHVTLPWLYSNLRNDVRYVYISNFNLNAQSFFYQTPIKELQKYHELSSIHLNTNDVFSWFSNTFTYGIRSKVIPATRIFGDDVETALYPLAVGFITSHKLAEEAVAKYVKDDRLWQLCAHSPQFRYTSKYPLVAMPSPIADAQDLRHTTFHTLSEYPYASTGMADLLSRGAGIFKGKSGKNSKMAFIFMEQPAFDEIKLANRIYDALEGTSYKPYMIEQGLQATSNLFAVPAIKYFELYPDAKQ